MRTIYSSFFSLLFVWLLFPGAVISQTLDDSLKFHWRLDSTYADSGSAANPLQKVAGTVVTFPTGAPVTGSRYLELDGSGGLVATNTVNNQSWTATTMSTWLKVKKGMNGALYGGAVIQGAYVGFHLLAEQTTSTKARVKAYFSGSGVNEAIYDVSLDTWVHVLAQNNGTTTELYINGVLVDTRTETLYTTTTANLPLAKIYIGQNSPGSSSPKIFEGAISDIRIYNRIMTRAEIDMLSNTVAVGSKRIYVNNTATGDNTGSNWADAYTDLQVALTSASANDTLWVASGTFLPQSDTTGNASPAEVWKKAFLWNKNLHLYGGFAGTETHLSQRPAAGRTALSGDLVGNINSRTVMYARNLNATSLIDGFIFEKGDNPIMGTGGGLYCTSVSMLTIQHCEFRDNVARRGAGLHANTQSLLVVKHCTFHDNSCTTGANPAGAAAQGYNSNFFFQHCIFYNNAAEYGSVIELEGNASGSALQNTIFANCLFYDNMAGYWGSPVVYCYNASATLYNCTLANNTTNSSQSNVSEAIGSNDGGITLYNSILWSNSNRPQVFQLGLGGSTLHHCVVKGGYTGAGSSSNIATYPEFVDSAANNFRLLINSPALNVGKTDTTGMMKWIGATDLDGNGRFYGNTIDIGCYELQANVATDPARTASIRLYPNPAHDLLTVETTTPGPVTIRDLTGKTLMDAANPGKVTLNISELPAGIYLLQLLGSEGIPFIKQ